MWIDVNSLTRHFPIMDYHLTINRLGGNTLENDPLFALVDSTSVIAGLRISVPGPTVGLKQVIHHRALHQDDMGQIYDPCARQISAFLPSGPTHPGWAPPTQCFLIQGFLWALLFRLREDDEPKDEAFKPGQANWRQAIDNLPQATI